MTDPSGLEPLGRLLPTLALLVGALLAVRWWAQRGRVGTAGALRVLARAGVTKGAVVAVVEVAGRRFLVGAGEHGVRLLSELAAEAGAEELTGGAFGPGLGGPVSFTAAALVPPSAPPTRPRMARIDRLRAMTVRQPPRRPARDPST